MQFLAQDLAHCIPAERTKDDDPINAIQRFLSEGAVYGTVHGCRTECGAVRAKPQAGTTSNRAAQIGSHDDDSVPEVCCDAAAVGQSSIVKDLQKEIPYPGISLLK